MTAIDPEREKRHDERANRHHDALLPLAEKFLSAQRPQNRPVFDGHLQIRTFLACITNARLRRLTIHNSKLVEITSRSQMASMWAVIREVNSILPDLLLECRREWPDILDCTPNWLDVEEAADMALMTEA